MALPFYLWSRTAASNATADPTVNWQEGQAPSSVNDSGRAMMASTSAFRDDIAGAIVTGGTSTVYTVTSYQVFDSLAHMNGQMIAFTPHVTNGDSPTLNVDGLGAKGIRPSANASVPAGTLLAGTPYVAIYNNSDAVWYLQSFYGNPYNIPIGAGIEYWGPTAPNSSFVLPIGQAISRTSYATLFSLFGTTYGSGDGSTTFNIPDKRGRVSAMLESSSSRLTSAYFGGNSTTFGATGGGESSTLITGNLPAYTPTGSLSLSTPVSTSVTTTVTGTASVTSNNWIASSSSDSTAINPPAGGGGSGITASLSGGSVSKVVSNGSISASASSPATSTATPTGTFNGVAQGGASTPVRTVQPTIICNYIMRVI